MKDFNAFKVYMRALTLLISFVIVVSVIAYLRNDQFHHFIESTSRDWGLLPPAQVMKLGKSESLRICRTRIDSIEWSNHAHIFEDKSKAQSRWLSQVPGSAPKELDSLEIEKWFGINCVIKIYKQTSTPAAMNEFLKIQFVDASTEVLKKSSDSLTPTFVFAAESFKSPELVSSLSELYRLGSFDLREPK